MGKGLNAIKVEAEDHRRKLERLFMKQKILNLSDDNYRKIDCISDSHLVLIYPKSIARGAILQLRKNGIGTIDILGFSVRIDSIYNSVKNIRNIHRNLSWLGTTSDGSQLHHYNSPLCFRKSLTEYF